MMNLDEVFCPRISLIIINFAHVTKDRARFLLQKVISQLCATFKSKMSCSYSFTLCKHQISMCFSTYTAHNVNIVLINCRQRYN